MLGNGRKFDPDSIEGSALRIAGRDDHTSAPAGCPAPPWRLDTTRVDTGAHEQPRDHRVRVPHLAGVAFVSSPDKGWNGRLPTKHPVKRRVQEPQDQDIADALHPHPHTLTLMRHRNKNRAPSRVMDRRFREGASRALVALVLAPDAVWMLASTPTSAWPAVGRESRPLQAILPLTSGNTGWAKSFGGALRESNPRPSPCKGGRPCRSGG